MIMYQVCLKTDRICIRVMHKDRTRSKVGKKNIHFGSSSLGIVESNNPGSEHIQQGFPTIRDSWIKRQEREDLSDTRTGTCVHQ